MLLNTTSGGRFHVIANGTARIYYWPAGRQVWTWHAWSVWPAGTRLYRNVGRADGTNCGTDCKTRRRLASHDASLPRPLLGVWREDTTSLAPHGDFLAPRRIHSSPLGLGVRGSSVLVCGLSPHGVLVLWWLRGGGISQPPLSALLHGLLPAQCRRLGRASIHAHGKRIGGSRLSS